MALQSLTFEEARFDPIVGLVLCSTGDNTIDDTVSAASPQNTGARIIIAAGNMFVQPFGGGRILFFTRFSNDGCALQANGRLVIRFPAPQRFVSFRLHSDFVGAGDAPVRVDFFAAEGAPAGTPPLQTQNFPPAFPFTTIVTYSDAAQPVREVRITTRSAENFIDDLQFSDTVPASLRDVAAAFDGSGSMAAQGKWRAMIEAGDLFYDLYRAIGDPADTFGGVVFRWDCATNLGGSQISQLTPAAPLSAAVNLPALFAADSPHGCTPIGEGVLTAAEMVNGGSNPNKTVLLLTDGINNRGRSVAEADVSPQLQGVTVHTIGLGTDAQIDPAAISDLAASHGGDFRQTTNPVEIADFFVQSLAQILGKAELAVVSGNDAVIAAGTTKAVFLVAWDVGAAAIDFDLQAPDGTVFNSSSPAPAGAVTAISYQGAGGASFHSFFVVDGPDLGGTWSFLGVPAGARKLAVEDLSLRVHWSITPKLGLTGEPIVVRARITRAGKPFTGSAQVRARVTSPGGSTAEILATGGKLIKGAPPQPDRNLRTAVAAQGLKAMNLKELPAPKTGQKTFTSTGKGEYELVLGATDQDGVYRFDLEAESQGASTPFHRRITLFSVLLSAPAPGAGTVTLLPADTGLVRVEVTPVRKDKRPVGPFLAPWVKLVPAQGRFLGKLTDHLDGRYSQMLAWDGKGAQSIAVEVLGRRFAGAKPSKGGKSGKSGKAGAAGAAKPKASVPNKKGSRPGKKKR